jgi:hypothetical protein
MRNVAVTANRRNEVVIESPLERIGSGPGGDFLVATHFCRLEFLDSDP